MDLRDPQQAAYLFASLQEQMYAASSDEEARAITSRIAQLTRQIRIQKGIGLPRSPLVQAMELDQKYRSRPHLELLSNSIASAVQQVEMGKNQRLAISMPPRAGKSKLISQSTPVWLLRRHPEWSIVLASYDGSLTSGWARDARRTIEYTPGLGVALKPDKGATTRWETIEGGGMYATSVRGALTGRGARVMIIDDPIRDFVEAHSSVIRQNLWDWWLSVAQTRLEPPYLVIVVMTRWHEDDMIGRLFSNDYEGDPRDWQRISIPALAESDGDLLGRSEGEPLLSPLLNEDEQEAALRWEDTKRAVGTYTFSAMYQQRPAPARGMIFDAGWWRFWTMDASRETEDGRVVFVDPATFTGGRWLDSWDCSFKATGSSDADWVVGQRWVRAGANRYLVAQKRGRWSFTQTIKEMENWANPDDNGSSPFGRFVHERLIEERANGAAIIDVLKDKISGIKPVNPTISKEARARAITPEVESGNVFLPHPGDPGNEWVTDFLSEVRNFPYDAHDDQVDSTTQALAALRDPGRASVTVPGRQNQPRGLQTWQQPQDLARGALNDMARVRRQGG